MRVTEFGHMYMTDNTIIDHTLMKILEDDSLKGISSDKTWL